MFIAEYEYERKRRISFEKVKGVIDINSQRKWKHNENSAAEGVGLAGCCVFAQNAYFLELCNPGLEEQWKAIMGSLFVCLPALFVISGWYGLTIHPAVFNDFFLWGKVIPYDGPDQDFLVWFGWLFVFPLAIGCVVLLYGWFVGIGNRACFFTYLRGRIRFNRVTRKVYVLRPKFCGGNKVFDWDELVALMSRFPADDPRHRTVLGVLILYYGPPHAKTLDDEDAIFVGNLFDHSREEQAAALWEYIRRYMEIGPSIDRIPTNAPADFKEIPRYLPADYFTFCGKLSADQYQAEFRPGFMETICYMLSQMTCSWPRFPPEWQSDSGLGEPQDNPVQTGAVMTALVYRAMGKLSVEDEVEFLTHYGTPEALKEAQERQRKLVC